MESGVTCNVSDARGAFLQLHRISDVVHHLSCVIIEQNHKRKSRLDLERVVNGIRVDIFFSAVRDRESNAAVELIDSSSRAIEW